jgi:hypothetical protein
MESKIIPYRREQVASTNGIGNTNSDENVGAVLTAIRCKWSRIHLLLLFRIEFHPELWFLGRNAYTYNPGE